MGNLTSIIQNVAQECVKNLKMADIAIGTVLTAGPLSVQIDDSDLVLPGAALLLTDSVSARIENVQGGQGGTVQVQYSLKAGDKVIMVRAIGGQKYVILSKVL